MRDWLLQFQQPKISANHVRPFVRHLHPRPLSPKTRDITRLATLVLCFCFSSVFVDLLGCRLRLRYPPALLDLTWLRASARLGSSNANACGHVIRRRMHLATAQSPCMPPPELMASGDAFGHRCVLAPSSLSCTSRLTLLQDDGDVCQACRLRSCRQRRTEWPRQSSHVA